MIATVTDLLPTPQQTRFLRACLHDDIDSVRAAWARWQADATAGGLPVRRALAPVNAFLPLLGWNLRRAGVPLDSGLTTHLRAAALTEELRWRTYREICADAFRLLNEHGVPFIGLNGAVVGTLAYPEPLFRHADDIDVLVHDADVDRAVALFVKAGWSAGRVPIFANPTHAPPLFHPTDVPIALHRSLLSPYYTLPYGALWSRSRMVSVAGHDIRVLSDPDGLLHACGHGMSGLPELRWVADAWFLLARSRAFDWDTFLATATSSRLGLLMCHATRYLADEIGAPVPREVVASLEKAAATTGFIGRSLARPWPAEPAADRPWRRQLPALWRKAFPPLLLFAHRYDLPLWSVPFHYLYRLARGASEAMRGQSRS